jgi:hypothetical protein
MKLLDALVSAIEQKQVSKLIAKDGTTARLAHFAFADDGSNAFLSEVETEELVPLLEEWCRQQRTEMVVQ